MSAPGSLWIRSGLVWTRCGPALDSRLPYSESVLVLLWTRSGVAFAPVLGSRSELASYQQGNLNLETLYIIVYYIWMNNAMNS